MNEKDKNRFSEFLPVSTEAWEAQIRADLNGADYEKRLIWNTDEGIQIKPYYRKEDLSALDHSTHLSGQFPSALSKPIEGNAWLIRQDIQVDDFSSANEKAIALISKGITSIGFIFHQNYISNENSISDLLCNIDLESIEINLLPAQNHLALAKDLVSFLTTQEIDKQKLNGSLTIDPFGSYARKGKFNENELADLTQVKLLLEVLADFPNVHIVALNGCDFTNAGASAVQELAFSLAIGAEYLDKLTDLGVLFADLSPRIRLNLGVGGNYFMELAKHRSARLLWSKLVGSYGKLLDLAPDSLGALRELYIHSETTLWNKTVYDPHVNILRTQTEAMSAVLGGTDSLTILPFRISSSTTDEFSERIARNQQLLLQHEAHFDKVADPAAGSYYIETLTNEISEKAWELFLQIQDLNGYLAALKKGFIQEQLRDISSKRLGSVASRLDKVLGINKFPDPSDHISLELKDCLFKAVDSSDPDSEIETIKQVRRSQPLESLRYATDHFSISNKRPTVFLLPVGDPIQSAARAQFSAEFFGVVGYEIVDIGQFGSLDIGLTAALEAQPSIVVLCSSDAEYEELAPVAYSILKNKSIFVVAGAPACMDKLKQMGIKQYISKKSNLGSILAKFNRKLGINNTEHEA
jgi:methylmalonyl-CoA mutase